MKQRLNVPALTPDLYKAVLALDTAVRNSGIDHNFLHLIKLRASQINGCAYCVDMHVKESLADGIPAQKLHLVSVWRESPLFDERERAVLDWTESVTLLAETGVPDGVYDALAKHFSSEQIAQLIMAIGTINIWNRIAVSARNIHS